MMSCQRCKDDYYSHVCVRYCVLQCAYNNDRDTHLSLCLQLPVAFQGRKADAPLAASSKTAQCKYESVAVI